MKSAFLRKTKTNTTNNLIAHMGKLFQANDPRSNTLSSRHLGRSLHQCAKKAVSAVSTPHPDTQREHFVRSVLVVGMMPE